MTALTLAALIVVLEDATAGTWTLDEEINRALSPDPDQPWLGPGFQYDDSRQPGQNAQFVTYTTSIDDALTLVPEGYRFEVLWGRSSHEPWTAALENIKERTPVRGESMSSAALAICIAALRAHAASKG